MTENPDPRALRRSPAQPLWEAMAAASHAGVTLDEEPFATHLAVRAVPGSESAATVSRGLGVALPAQVGEVTAGQTPGGVPVSVLWIGPDEFLAVLPDLPDPHALAEALTGELANVGGPTGHVLDVSANRTTLVLRGDRARDVLETGIDLDLHPRRFPVGTAVATLLESVGVVLWRTGEDEWKVLPRASFARHTAAWLMDALGAVA